MVLLGVTQIVMHHTSEMSHASCALTMQVVQMEWAADAVFKVAEWCLREGKRQSICAVPNKHDSSIWVSIVHRQHLHIRLVFMQYSLLSLGC